MRFHVASSNDDNYFRLLRPYLIFLKVISQIIDVVKTANNDKMQQIDTKYLVAKYLHCLFSREMTLNKMVGNF